jgi:hypothetical protein
MNRQALIVMAGLDPAIHVDAGTSPGMTVFGVIRFDRITL